MEYIARHYNMDLPLARRLSGGLARPLPSSGIRKVALRTRMAGRLDFESTPASKEKPDKSITIFDYHKLLSKTGWEVTHRIECPPAQPAP
jgi:hypothetical protein